MVVKVLLDLCILTFVCIDGRSENRAYQTFHLTGVCAPAKASYHQWVKERSLVTVQIFHSVGSSLHGRVC